MDLLRGQSGQITDFPQNGFIKFPRVNAVLLFKTTQLLSLFVCMMQLETELSGQASHILRENKNTGLSNKMAVYSTTEIDFKTDT